MVTAPETVQMAVFTALVAERGANQQATLFPAEMVVKALLLYHIPQALVAGCSYCSGGNHGIFYMDLPAIHRKPARRRVAERCRGDQLGLHGNRWRKDIIRVWHG